MPLLSRDDVFPTLLCSILAVEMFFILISYKATYQSFQPVMIGENQYASNKRKQFEKLKHDVPENHTSKSKIKDTLGKHLYTMSQYLARGLRYEKDASIETVGDRILSLIQPSSIKHDQFFKSDVRSKTVLFVDSSVKDEIKTEHIGKVFVSKDSDSRRTVLNELVKDNSIEVVIILHGTFIDLSNSSTVQKLVSPILTKKADLIGTTVVDKQGNWKLGCYLRKVLWFQYRISEGYDLKPGNKDGYLDCDYMAGAFAIRKELLSEFLGSKRKLSMQYAHLFSFIREKDMVAKLCINCVSLQQRDSIKLFPNNRNAFKDFLVESKLSKFIPPDNNAMELSCSQSKMSCWPLKGKGILISKCCIKELDELLLNTLRECDARGWFYTLIAGTLIGALKLEQTLPWELDHDFQLDANKLIPLKGISNHFRTKYGYSFIYELNGAFPKCLETKTFVCGWIGIKSKNWRLEVPGRCTLYSDINRNGADITIATPYQNSRVKVNTTLSLVSGYWAKSHGNPGNYIRVKYGKNALKHVKHIYANRLSHAQNYLKRKVFKWDKCARPGYHACHSEVPVDGNLGFRDVWV